MFSEIAQFTSAAAQDTLPKRPRIMTKEEVRVVGKFIMEEVYELFDASFDSREMATKEMCSLVEYYRDRKVRNKPTTEVDVIEQQADALIDIVYYCGDAGAKVCFPLDRIFELVHAANMKKIDKDSGKVLRREEDGKILKPDGWQPADLREVILSQMQ